MRNNFKIYFDQNPGEIRPIHEKTLKQIKHFGYKTKSTKANQWKPTQFWVQTVFAFDNFTQWIHSTTAAETTEIAANMEEYEMKQYQQLAATQHTNNWKQKPTDRRTYEEDES